MVSTFRDESEFVRWLQRLTPTRTRSLRLGIGDDAALVRVPPSRELILTTDLSIEGVHFTRSIHSPRSVGHRALARSLSDVAAMGGVPRYALISLALSRTASPNWVEGLYRGIRDLARRFRVVVIGGDTARVAGATLVDVIAIGEVRRGQALRRDGARPGDQLWVSGRLGLAAWGLELLKSGKPWRSGDARAALQAHLYPEPQCALGRFLSERRLASAVIDISDGLSSDLTRLCAASSVGALVWAQRLPLPATGNPGQALALALRGGEDYQLLFAVPARVASRLPSWFRGLPLQQIGEIRKGHGLALVTSDGKKQPLKPTGWDYFRK
jgi:thiamine-monophosphate kinase